MEQPDEYRNLTPPTYTPNEIAPGIFNVTDTIRAGIKIGEERAVERVISFLMEWCKELQVDGEDIDERDRSITLNTLDYIVGELEQWHL